MIEWTYHLDVLLRMSVALILGFLIGLQRSKEDKPAGIKTHALVSLGASLIMIIGDYGHRFVSEQIDMTRLASQVVSGVGFIGAGTILITQRKAIIGLTSAAIIWLTAGLGLAVGIGYYFLAISATILVLILLHVSTDFERWLSHRQRNLRFIKIRVDQVSALAPLLDLVGEFGGKVERIARKETGVMKITIRLPAGSDRTDLLTGLVKIEGAQLL